MEILKDMKQYIVVKIRDNDEEYNKIVINKDDLRKVVYFGDCNDTFKITKNLSGEEIENLEKQYKILSEKYKDNWNIGDQDILKEILNIDIEYVDIYEDVEKDKYIIFINGDDIEYCDIYFYDNEYIYTYWDGSNHCNIDIEENCINKDMINYNPEKLEWESLDEWDGRNWKFIHDGSHVHYTKLGDKWILEESSDWQGTHTYFFEFNTKEEIIEWGKEKREE